MLGWGFFLLFVVAGAVLGEDFRETDEGTLTSTRSGVSRLTLEPVGGGWRATRRPHGETQSEPLATKAALAHTKVTQCSQKIYAAKIWPIRVTEVVLRVC